MAPQEVKTPANGQDAGGDGQARIGKMAGCLEDIERARKQRSLISLTGLLLILLAIVIFAFNLVGFVRQVAEDDSFQTEIMSKVQEDMADLLHNDPDLKMLVRELQEDVIPYAIEQVTKRFREELPAYREHGEEILDRLHAYLEKDVKEKLGEVLADVLAEIEQQLIEKYPTVTPEELQAAIATAQILFIEEVTTLVERKLDVVAEDLGALKESVELFKDTPEYHRLLEDLKVDREGALNKTQLAMIEHMLELVIYHINPERGDEPVIAATGGVQ